MTKHIEEARVIAFAAAGQVCNNEDAKCVETLVEKLVYAALAAAEECGRKAERAKIDEERGYIEEALTASLAAMPVLAVNDDVDGRDTLVERLKTEIKRLDDIPPSIQSQANIRLINAVREAICYIEPATDFAAENERLRAAVTPSAETRAAYIGEFIVHIEDRDEDVEECSREITVPWMTVKDIMKAISEYTALEREP